METTERRKHHRKRMLQAGKIVYGKDALLIDCMIRDRTDNGARLKVADSKDVPEQIRLFIAGENTITNSKVIWRSEREIGIEFTGAAEPVRESHDAKIRLLRVHS